MSGERRPLRLFLDEDVHLALADALRKRGYDAIHTNEGRRAGFSDESQLSFAASENRCLVTFNVGDFVQLHNRWIDLGREHCGIIVSRQLPVGESLRRLLAFLQREDAETMKTSLRFL
jgi:predicted nuclease of predicted toxin-antitoxin system